MITDQDPVRAVFSFFDQSGEAAKETHGPTVEPASSFQSVFDENIDTHIKQALDAIPAGCQPGALEAHVRAFIEMLVSKNAGIVVASNALNTLNTRLKALSLATVAKKGWAKMFREAEATAQNNNPTPSPVADSA